VVNAENAAGGAGITPPVARDLFLAGVDCLMSGDHIWDKKEILEVIDRDERILRPCNYPDGIPGRGATVLRAENGIPVGVINTIGRVFMREQFDCPFKMTKHWAEELREKTPIVIVDMHAEATSEKIALGWYLDGEVSAIFGTHTHVQTADERILPNETASITDLGMVGAWDSVIGMGKETIIKRFLTQMPAKFDVPKSKRVIFNAIKLDIHPETGKSIGISRIQRQYQFDEPIDSSHD